MSCTKISALKGGVEYRVYLKDMGNFCIITLKQGRGFYFEVFAYADFASTATNRNYASGGFVISGQVVHAGFQARRNADLSRLLRQHMFRWLRVQRRRFL